MNKEILDKTLEVNEEQKKFYNSKEVNKENVVAYLWSKIRNGLLSNFRNEFDIKTKVYDQHKVWLGDLSDKKVLDLGCLRGNELSIYMAKNAKEYIGIDLSDVAIGELQEKLKKENCPNAIAKAVDFLSPEFPDKDFDVIYAYGVLHHFQSFELLLSKLDEKLSPEGIIISYDPLETSFPIKLLRWGYRPFQQDKDWEWPFKKATFKQIENHYVIKEKRGVLGKSKYGIVINFLPFSKKRKKAIISKFIEKDWSAKSWSDTFSCMHLTMVLTKK